MSGTPIKLVVRTEFTSVQNSDVEKFEGQADIPMIAGLDNVLAERIVSRPAAGHRQVFNLTYDPNDEELIIEISENDAA